MALLLAGLPEQVPGVNRDANLVQQRSNRHAKWHGKLLDDGDRRIARAAFDIADIGAVDAGLVRIALLAPALLGAKAAQVSSEALANIHARA